MSFRAKAVAVLITAAALIAVAPAAMASSGSPHSVQVTGKQLKSALLPPRDFQPDYTSLNASNSGGSLENGSLDNVASMSCRDFWSLVGIVEGFGETAFANAQVLAKSGAAPIQEVFEQSVYQFASTHAAASFYGKVSARYRSCRSTSFSDTHGGTLHQTVHSRSSQRVGGHHALLLIEYLTDSSVAGPGVATWALWTLDSTDVYMINSQLLSGDSPQPTLSSLTLKLIARVSALR